MNTTIAQSSDIQFKLSMINSMDNVTKAFVPSVGDLVHFQYDGKNISGVVLENHIEISIHSTNTNWVRIAIRETHNSGTRIAIMYDISINEDGSFDASYSCKSPVGLYHLVGNKTSGLIKAMNDHREKIWTLPLS